TGAKFMMNNNSLFAIRLLKDTEGNYLWRPGWNWGSRPSLAGYGIAENEQHWREVHDEQQQPVCHPSAERHRG
ncbi:phage major capsid protein, partial [Escherichia coli]